MRVAVLLTVQLRTVDMLKYLHLHSLINPYDADVFLGINLNNKQQNTFKNSTETSNLEQANKVIDFSNRSIHFY